MQDHPYFNAVVQGDCLELMQNLPNGSVDMVLCDLPYGTTQNKWDTVIPFGALWQQYRRVCKGNAAIVLTASQPFTSALVMSCADAFRYAWVWRKNTATGHLNAKRMPMKEHEDIVVFGSAGAAYNPQGLVSFNKVTRRGSNGDNFGKSGTSNYQEFTNYPKSILEFGLDPAKLHPTQKPVALFEYLIRTYTHPGDLVLDNCCGSGTTGVAARQTNRNFICMELDDAYCEIAYNRICSVTPSKANAA